MFREIPANSLGVVCFLPSYISSLWVFAYFAFILCNFPDDASLCSHHSCGQSLSHLYVAFSGSHMINWTLANKAFGEAGGNDLMRLTVM